jgi:hypothetical protein
MCRMSDSGHTQRVIPTQLPGDLSQETQNWCWEFSTKMREIMRGEGIPDGQAGMVSLLITIQLADKLGTNPPELPAK